ncbi:hypothetical protein UFOVP1382_10 [uncultured Caudovirales phage]|uniref:Uncharacterized protein n=1 Tax=uncultured Caudovirales phage TaxID=2100421 RepID=A0A6J5RXA5_9CAUD|nr:hypothetical protein UFOVP1382_10 [uncultured Caudovirales phage]
MNDENTPALRDLTRRICGLAEDYLCDERPEVDPDKVFDRPLNEVRILFDDNMNIVQVRIDAPGHNQIVKPDEYAVWAIEHDVGTATGNAVTAVSAESEYAAIKHFVGNGRGRPIRVEKIEGRKPRFGQRWIEGYTKHEFKPETKDWRYS